MGQTGKKGSLREVHPDLAQFVDVMRAEFGPEAGGRLTVRGEVERAWGAPLADDDRAHVCTDGSAK